MKKTTHIGRVTAACGAMLALAALPGCYTHVIDAKGIGADSRHPKTSEPTQPVGNRLFRGSDEKK
ncbi:MAG: hypothetical protein RIB60_09975 [Phycisphaerales bacterium]